jgi:hypothetical protein
MKYAVEMGSVAVVYIPSFIETGSGIQVIRGDAQTDRKCDRYTAEMDENSKQSSCYIYRPVPKWILGELC